MEKQKRVLHVGVCVVECWLVVGCCWLEQSLENGGELELGSRMTERISAMTLLVRSISAVYSRCLRDRHTD